MPAAEPPVTDRRVAALWRRGSVTVSKATVSPGPAAGPHVTPGRAVEQHCDRQTV